MIWGWGFQNIYLSEGWCIEFRAGTNISLRKEEMLFVSLLKMIALILIGWVLINENTLAVNRSIQNS